MPRQRHRLIDMIENKRGREREGESDVKMGVIDGRDIWIDHFTNDKSTDGSRRRKKRKAKRM